MIIPIRTDYRMARTPWVNYALLAANVALYVMGFNGQSERSVPWLLHPDDPQLAQFFSSMFMHSGWMHLLSNMVFLWVFGNGVNDRFGHLGYLMFYLAGGVLAGIGYLLFGGVAPVLGASGAISAVTGAYLVLLPRARVTVLALLIYVFVPFDVPSLYFLLFQFIVNLWMSLSPGMSGRFAGGVAYAAHSSGYAFGIAVSAGLLAIRALPRDPFDLLNLLRTSRRRYRYRQTVAQGYDPFSHVRPDLSRTPAGWGQPPVVPPPLPTADEARELELRRGISESITRGDVPTAAQKYLLLIQIAERAVLSSQQQLDVANQLMSAEQYPAAADAYERFLLHYGPQYPQVGDIYLMLGLLYGRYVQQYDRAERYLQLAIEKLADPQKLAMARSDLQAVRKRRAT